LIEDNKDVASYILGILKTDYQLKHCTNGAAGIEEAFKIIPDIIISDIMMPIKNGYEVCQTLKEDERTSHIPIILLTAKVAQEDKLEGLGYGADAFINKPFHKEELFIRLKQLVITRNRIQSYYSKLDKKSEKHLPLEAPNLEDNFIKKIDQLIKENLANPEFGVQDVKLNNRMNQKQIYRKLKALTGMSISKYIRLARLNEAKSLLENSELNISEVAYAVGFNDPSYFARVFQAEFKKSPRDYRKI